MSTVICSPLFAMAAHCAEFGSISMIIPRSGAPPLLLVGGTKPEPNPEAPLVEPAPGGTAPAPLAPPLPVPCRRLPLPVEPAALQATTPAAKSENPIRRLAIMRNAPRAERRRKLLIELAQYRTSRSH